MLHGLKCAACSSAFMALHDAVMDLQRGRVEYAVVGGSSAIFRPATSLAFLRLKCAQHTTAATPHRVLSALCNSNALNVWIRAKCPLPARMLSPEGACKSFDASGNGYARAEGVAAIILRRSDVAAMTPWVVKRAPAATIVGMGTNNDGHTEQGITFPSGPAQRELGTAVRSFAS